jgi:hypothetical protein
MTTPSLLDAAQTEPSMAAASIPPAPEGVERMRRMPHIDELPLSRQNEIRKKLRHGHPEKRRMTRDPEGVTRETQAEGRVR